MAIRYKTLAACGPFSPYGPRRATTLTRWQIVDHISAERLEPPKICVRNGCSARSALENTLSRRGAWELITKPRPLAVIRNRRLNSVALLVPLRSVQFTSSQTLPSAPDRPLTMVYQNPVTVGAGVANACVFFILKHQR